MWRQTRVAVLRVVKAESSDLRVGRPIALLHAEHAAEHGQHLVRRVLRIEDWIRSARKAELTSQRVNWLRPLARDKAREASHGAAHPRHRLICPRQSPIR